jgi:hypothetical protein
VNPDPLAGEQAVADLLDRADAAAPRPQTRGIPDALRRISADAARFRAGAYTPPAWWAQRTGDRLALDALARSTVVDPAALARIASFAGEYDQDNRHEGGTAVIRVVATAEDDVDAEIEGSRLFGCLLHLTGHPLSARFWWRLAAGAGDRVAAFCVYLQHLQRGELREAEWWLREASRTEAAEDAADGSGALPPGLPDMPEYFRAVPAMLGPCDARAGVRPSAALVEEVDRLVAGTGPADADDGTDGIACRPGPGFATRVQELVGPAR